MRILKPPSVARFSRSVVEYCVMMQPPSFTVGLKGASTFGVPCFGVQAGASSNEREKAVGVLATVSSCRCIEGFKSLA